MPMDPPKRPLEEIMEGDRLMPTAPGDDGPEEIPYMRSVSAPPINDMTGMPFEPCNGDFTHIHCGPVRQISEHSGHHHHANQHQHPHHQHPQPSSNPHFMHHQHSYPGCMINRQDSAISNISAYSRGNRSTGGGDGRGSGSGGAGDRNSHCPNCSAKPPTYSESFQHPVMDQQISHASNQDESPPYSPPGSPVSSS